MELIQSGPAGDGTEAPGADEPERQRVTLQFSGQAGEYFRIWIVNVSLTILTIGLYSPWAKVRRNRYIYGNLSLAGSYFDYLATPLQILRGRLIAVAVLAGCIGVELVVPAAGTLVFGLISLLTPWLIVRSRMFNMRYTAFRNIRFGFNPAYADSYTVIFWYGFLSVITLGLAVPYAHFARNEFIVRNTRFGALPFGFDAAPGRFFLAYGLGALLTFTLFAPLSGLLRPAADAESGWPVYAVTGVLASFFFYYVVAKFVAAFILRVTTNGTQVGGADHPATARLGCDWTLPRMLGIYASNLVAIVFSAGLLVPWAQMRILRYQLSHTWLDVEGDLDSVLAGQSQQVSSLGEELGDVFDVDIGL